MVNEPCIGVLGPIPLAAFGDILPELGTAGGLDGLGGPPVHFHVRELLRRGRRVTLFTLDPAIEEERVFESERLKICVGPYTQHRGRNWFRRERAYLLRALQRERPAVLSAHWTYEFALAAIASGIPHVVTAHDAPWRVLRHDVSPYRLVRTAMAYQAARQARRLVAVSPYVAGHLRRFGFHGHPIDVIPTGRPPHRPAPARPRPAGAAATFAGIFSGGWQGLKNGAALLDAFALLRRDLPQARLMMIGDGCEPGGSAALWAGARGIAAGIAFLGRLPHQRIVELLATEIGVLVHPSLEESFGMTLIEAGALGAAVIAGRDSGAVPWVLGEGEYGLLVDVRSPAGIARAMLHLARDQDMRSRLAAAAQSAVRDRFDITRVTDRYEEIFAQLSRPAAPGP